MSVRRGTTRFATVFTLLAGLLVAGAAPAMADGDRMQIRAASSFTAGDSPGSVTLGVTRRADGCVSVRTALGIRLTGLSADQVQVQVASDGDWRPVSVSTGGDGLLVTEQTAPDRDRLCHRKSVGARYRLAFLSGAPGGSATIVGTAYADGGDLIASATVSRQVVGGRAPSPTESPSPLPTAEPAVVPQGPAQSQAAAAPAAGGGLFGIGTLVMLIGVAMVGIGIALLVFLIRRSRAEDGVPAAVGPFRAGSGAVGPFRAGSGAVGPFRAGSGAVGPFPPGSGAAMLPNAAVPGGDGAQTRVLPRGRTLPGSAGPGPVGPGGPDGPPTLILPRLPD